MMLHAQKIHVHVRTCTMQSIEATPLNLSNKLSNSTRQADETEAVML